PPLGGFFGKWYVLTAAVAEERWHFAAAIVAGSLASIVYVFRILQQILFARPPGEEPSGFAARFREGPAVAVLACLTLAAVVVLLGVGNERVVSLLVAKALPGTLP
ncbi:MAG: hypothetical protein QME96_19065, partial [Myxococcota bacterium]|nr:hypothetical protein [Myxococcota bacterium]